MVQVPLAWQAAMAARAVRGDPGLVVNLRLSYNPRRLPVKLAAKGISLAQLHSASDTVVSFSRGRPSADYPELAYTIRTPGFWLRAANVERDGVTVAQIVDAGALETSLPPRPSPCLTLSMYSIDDCVPFDLDAAYRKYETALRVASGRANAMAKADSPDSPVGRRRADLDRRLLPELAVLDLVAKRREVTSSASAVGTVASGADALNGPGVLQVRMKVVSGAFTEDTEVDLELAEGSRVGAEVVEAVGDLLLLKPRWV